MSSRPPMAGADCPAWRRPKTTRLASMARTTRPSKTATTTTTAVPGARDFFDDDDSGGSAQKSVSNSYGASSSTHSDGSSFVPTCVIRASHSAQTITPRLRAKEHESSVVRPRSEDGSSHGVVGDDVAQELQSRVGDVSAERRPPERRRDVVQERVGLDVAALVEVVVAAQAAGVEDAEVRGLLHEKIAVHERARTDENVRILRHLEDLGRREIRVRPVLDRGLDRGHDNFAAGGRDDLAVPVGTLRDRPAVRRVPIVRPQDALRDVARRELLGLFADAQVVVDDVVDRFRSFAFSVEEEPDDLDVFRSFQHRILVRVGHDVGVRHLVLGPRVGYGELDVGELRGVYRPRRRVISLEHAALVVQAAQTWRRDVVEVRGVGVDREPLADHLEERQVGRRGDGDRRDGDSDQRVVEVEIPRGERPTLV
mmetsp:Transcript_13204/g.52925  ORF Transcript_13204/g.52925 Transcript_13204/m.52925 type:complete len:426 (-) Transcript_13204:355-1632(-)